jgi:serine/threonine protein kinase
MLAGYAPFYDADPMKSYTKILKGSLPGGSLNFPLHFSKVAIDIIRKFLNPKPIKRLGMITNGNMTPVQFLKSHPWFHKFDWNALINKKMAAPIVLSVKSAEDYSNFSTESKNIQIPRIKYASPEPQEWEKDF